MNQCKKNFLTTFIRSINLNKPKKTAKPKKSNGRLTSEKGISPSMREMNVFPFLEVL